MSPRDTIAPVVTDLRMHFMLRTLGMLDNCLCDAFAHAKALSGGREHTYEARALSEALGEMARLLEAAMEREERQLSRAKVLTLEESR